MCIPLEYSRGNEVTIPRGKLRAKLASKGLAGKIRLNSEMSENEIFAEIHSVFSMVMRNDKDFPFEVLLSAGGGTKSLIIQIVQQALSGQENKLFQLLAGHLYSRKQGVMLCKGGRGI